MKQPVGCVWRTKATPMALVDRASLPEMQARAAALALRPCLLLDAGNGGLLEDPQTICKPHGLCHPLCLFRVSSIPMMGVLNPSTALEVVTGTVETLPAAAGARDESAWRIS